MLDNAAKYTPEHGRIELSVTQAAGEARISISDNGLGIAPDLLPRVFEPFVQADRTLERTKGGLGIGLALVRKLVEAHGGSIEAHSEGLGKGSQFIVRLPAVDEPEAVAEAAGVVPAATRPRRRILVVEDNVDNAEMLTQYLESSGHEVATVGEGPSAHPHHLIPSTPLPVAIGTALTGGPPTDSGVRHSRTGL